MDSKYVQLVRSRELVLDEHTTPRYEPLGSGGSGEHSEVLVAQRAALKRKTTKVKSPRPPPDPWWPAIDPGNSLFLNMWDSFMGVLILIVGWVAPIQAVFVLPTLLDHVITSTLDSVFILDMVLQFFVMVPDPSRASVWTAEPWAIVTNYLSGWFWIDFFSILPVRMIAVVLAPSLKGELHLLRALRLCRLLRIARVSRLAQRWRASVSLNFAILAILQNFAMVTFCCHWMACMWSALALRDGPGPTWLTALLNSKEELSEAFDGQVDVYVMSLYWAVITITSIGYGDVVPQNRLEYLMATLSASLMASIWAYVIGAICGILSTLQPHEIDFKRSLDDLNLLIAERSVPRGLRFRLRRYFHESKELNRHRIERAVIERMSPALQGEVALVLHSEWIDRIWYLQGLSSQIIIWAARNLSMMVYAPKETIYKDRTVFIVRRGICARKAKVLCRGDVWGDDMLISNEHLRDHAKTLTLSYLDVCMLAHRDIADIIDQSPEAKIRINFARIRLAFVRGVTRIACEMTRLRNHPKSQAHFDELAGHHHVRVQLYKDILWGKDVVARTPEYIAHTRGQKGACVERMPSSAEWEDSDSVDPSRQMTWMVQKMKELAEAQAACQAMIADVHVKLGS